MATLNHVPPTLPWAAKHVLSTAKLALFNSPFTALNALPASYFPQTNFLAPALSQSSTISAEIFLRIAHPPNSTKILDRFSVQVVTSKKG